MSSRNRETLNRIDMPPCYGSLLEIAHEVLDHCKPAHLIHAIDNDWRSGAVAGLGLEIQDSGGTIALQQLPEVLRGHPHGCAYQSLQTGRAVIRAATQGNV